jgi:hypothetical protein
VDEGEQYAVPVLSSVAPTQLPIGQLAATLAGQTADFTIDSLLQKRWSDT